MRFLLDTHAFVWWLLNETKLSPKARSMIARPDSTIIVSAVNAFEIATKVRLGKFEEAREIDANFSRLVEGGGFMMLTINEEHALAAGHFECAHGDPFDRLLAAQAKIEDLTLITRDPAFAAFGVETLW